MSERLTNIDSVFMDNSCFNNRCDVKDICKHYNENPTADQRKRYPVTPCQRCKAFSDNREVVAEEEPNRPYLDSF